MYCWYCNLLLGPSKTKETLFHWWYVRYKVNLFGKIYPCRIAESTGARLCKEELSDRMIFNLKVGWGLQQLTANETLGDWLVSLFLKHQPGLQDWSNFRTEATVQWLKFQFSSKSSANDLNESWNEKRSVISWRTFVV